MNIKPVLHMCAYTTPVVSHGRHIRRIQVSIVKAAKRIARERGITIRLEGSRRDALVKGLCPENCRGRAAMNMWYDRSVEIVGSKAR